MPPIEKSPMAFATGLHMRNSRPRDEASGHRYIPVPKNFFASISEPSLM
jgi:hypothetical protein